jgi:hypothetical protein
MISMDCLQTLESAAAVLSVQPSTVRRWLRRGRIRSYELRLPISVGGQVLAGVYVRPLEILVDLAR